MNSSATAPRQRFFYCEAQLCDNDGICASQCQTCAADWHDMNTPDDGDTGEDTNVEDSYAR